MIEGRLVGTDGRGTSSFDSLRAMSTTEETDYRLSYAVAPRRYELHLTPDLEAATFAGTERVELEVRVEPLTAS